MASKAIYTVVAVVGIAAASGAAWWYQRPAPAGSASASSPASSGGGAAPSGGAPAAGRAPSVEVARVEVTRLTDETQAVGSLRSRRGVILRPEVGGRITQLNFTDGQRVRKGQVLVQFDDQLPLAQVQQAMAELSIAQANQKRNQELVAQNFVSQRSLDESSANLQVAQARLALARATAARLKIVAPFDGIVGIRQVNVGDYLKDGADIVNIEDIEAIFVDFRLPERLQSKVQRGQTATLDIDALPGRKYSAQIQAIDPLIDANGRSVGIRGCIDNRQLQLRPGMFARVNAVFGVRDNARVIPEEAIVPQGGRQFVIKLVEGPNDTRISKRVEVKVGLRSPGKVEILEGLEPGDTVVTAGQQRVPRDGIAVTVVDLSAPRGARPATAAASAPGATSAPPAGAAAPTAPAATASTSPAPTSAATAVPAPAAPATLSGPNPCGVMTAEAPASSNSSRSSTPDTRPAAATRNPA
ncbi:efflux RND transporter periplasmic adaptor subunit [Polaromonas sp. YR568]|uniref:efflux RND transporter periplasmic adaptor subunit n=1 Tax=Polaromonas sp. YR568 TaxID=1855301 RepID=UPI003138298A